MEVQNGFFRRRAIVGILVACLLLTSGCSRKQVESPGKDLEGFVKKKDESGNYYLRIYKKEGENRLNERQWYVYNATEDGSYGEEMRVRPNGLMVKDVRIFYVPNFYWSGKREIIYLGKSKDNRFNLLLREQYRDGRDSKNARTDVNQERLEHSLEDKSNILDIRGWKIEPIRLDGEDLIYKIVSIPGGKD